MVGDKAEARAAGPAVGAPSPALRSSSLTVGDLRLRSEGLAFPMKKPEAVATTKPRGASQLLHKNNSGHCYSSTPSTGAVTGSGVPMSPGRPAGTTAATTKGRGTLPGEHCAAARLSSKAPGIHLWHEPPPLLPCADAAQQHLAEHLAFTAAFRIAKLSFFILSSKPLLVVAAGLQNYFNFTDDKVNL